MGKCCEIIKYWLCCYKGGEDDYDGFDTICNIDWSAYQFDDSLYGAIKTNKENNDSN